MHRLKPAPDGEVLTREGEATTLHRLFGGKIVLLSFIYTHCADAQGCPWATAILQQVRSRLDLNKSLSERVRILSLSFDPENDTAETMREYARYFSKDAARWEFLTTRSPQRLEPILKGYRQTVQGEYGESGGFTGRFSHLLRVFLIDKEKQIRNVYSASLLDPGLLLNDLESLALEERGASVATQRQEENGQPTDLLKFVRNPPLGLPPVPLPEDNPITQEKVALGRKLFYDRRLSFNNTLSCALCHIPEQGFTSNELETAVGFEGRSLRRNAPTLYNVAYMEKLFHDGRESTLETQVWGPFLAANEMAAPSVGWLVERVRKLPDYQGMFERAFGRPASMELLGQAIASYERTLVSGNSPFDRWYFGKVQGAMSPEAQHGFKLFTGKAGCVACHTIARNYALFTDNKSHNTGLGWHNAMGKPPEKTRVVLAPGVEVELDQEAIEAVSERPAPDLGRYEVTQDPADRWKYKTPTLRNTALSAPYMHDGSMATLESVVEFYNQRGYPGPDTDPLLKPLGLTQDEQAELVAFLKALTGDNVTELVADAVAAPICDPEGGVRRK